MVTPALFSVFLTHKGHLPILLPEKSEFLSNQSESFLHKGGSYEFNPFTSW